MSEVNNSLVRTNNQYYTDIANAIRAKNGKEITYKPQDMPLAISNIGISEGDVTLFDLLKGDITSITIPDGVTNVRDNCFYNFTSLTQVTFSPTIQPTISTVAFQYCNKLTTINVPWSYGAVNGAPWGATNATINYNVT